MHLVLVVDDDAHIRTLIRFVLAAAGYDVILAADGREALDILENESPEVVVLDMNMPVMDGREFFRHLKERKIRPRTLILSAYQAEKARREIGAEASLEKPFGPDELVLKVEELSKAA